MYQSYDLSRYVDGDLSQSNSLTVSDHDVVNCAHMLAAGFNTMNRNMLGDFVLAVVDKKAGVVQYDGKVEMINRLEPPGPFAAGPFNFEATVPLDSSTLRQFFGIGTPSFTTFGKVVLDEPEPSKYTHISRDVLESAYAELEAVKEVLADAGVETIPADAGVRDLLAVKRVMSQQITRRDTDISELVQALAHRAAEVEELRNARSNAAARAELIEYVKRAHAKKVKLQTAVPDGDGRHDLNNRWRGMLDVLAKFLVVTGEADASEGHAVARRLCGIED